MSTRVRHWVFVRHAHPISAWSRWASTPLVVVPLWSRRHWTAVPIAAWMIINPVITPPPTDDRAFATRAILGEEQWIADPIKRVDIIALNAVGAACLSVAGVDRLAASPSSDGRRHRRIDDDHLDHVAQIR